MIEALGFFAPSVQPSAEDAMDLDDRAIKDKLRKILKRLGKLKCSKEVK